MFAPNRLFIMIFISLLNIKRKASFIHFTDQSQLRLVVFKNIGFASFVNSRSGYPGAFGDVSVFFRSLAGQDLLIFLLLNINFIFEKIIVSYA